MTIAVHATGGVKTWSGAENHADPEVVAASATRSMVSDVPEWAAGWDYWARLPDGARIATREALYDYPDMGHQWGYWAAGAAVGDEPTAAGHTELMHFWKDSSHIPGKGGDGKSYVLEIHADGLYALERPRFTLHEEIPRDTLWGRIFGKTDLRPITEGRLNNIPGRPFIGIEFS